MRFAYADPPYLGCGQKIYGSMHDEASDFDKPEKHAQVAAMMDEGFDGWALSLSQPSLRTLLPLMPEGARVAAWVKPFCSFKPGVNPANAWEPVVYKSIKRERSEATVRDWVSCNIALRRGFPGAKPHGFCMWLFSLIGAKPGDEFVDLFPGSGSVSAAWGAYSGSAVISDGLFSGFVGDGGV